MKFRSTLILFSLSIATLLAHAQSTDNPLYRHIPADADKVYHINVSAIAGKFDLQSLATVIPPKEDNKRIIAVISDPSSAGVDIRPGVIIAETNVMAIDSPRYTTMVVSLADSGKAIRLLKDEEKSSFVILGGKPRTAKSGSRTVFVWNDKMMVITMIKAPAMASPTDASRARFVQSAIRKSLAALKGSDTNPFITNPEFRKVFADDADVHTWSHFGSGLGMLSDAMRMSKAPVDKNFLQLAEQVKHSRSHTLGTIRFDNGLISLRSRVFYDSTVNLNLGNRPLNTDLIDRLPQGNLLGLASLHFDPAAWLTMLQSQNKGKGIFALDSMLAKKSLTTKDLVIAFKGDLILAVIDSGKTIPKTDTTPVRPGQPNVYVVVTIGDADAFAKVSNAFHLTRDTAGVGKWHPAHTLRDNLFVLGPSQQATDDYFNKTGRGPSRLVTDEVRSAPFAVAIDVKALYQYLQPMFAGSSKDKQMEMLFGLFDQIVFTTAKTHGREMENLFEIKMADSQQNSLTTISKLIQSMNTK